MVVPYEGHSAGFQHCAVHLVGWCLRRLLRGYESLSADHRVHAARARSIFCCDNAPDSRPNALSSAAGEYIKRAKRAIFKSPDCCSVRWAARAKN